VSFHKVIYEIKPWCRCCGLKNNTSRQNIQLLTVVMNSCFRTNLNSYNTEKSLKKKSDRVLEQHGKDGWELVNFQCVGGFGSMMVFVFKREKK